MHYTQLVQWVSLIPVFLLGLVCGEMLVARLDEKSILSFYVVSLIAWLGFLVFGLVRLLTCPPTPWNMLALFIFMILCAFVDRASSIGAGDSTDIVAPPDSYNFEQCRLAAMQLRRYNEPMADACNRLEVFNRINKAQYAAKNVDDAAVCAELALALSHRDQMNVCFEQGRRQEAYRHVEAAKASAFKIYRLILICEMLDAQDARARGNATR